MRQQIMSGIGGLILAAGLSSRMGDFKPLMRVGDKAMIERSIDSMLDAGVAHVTVVLGCRGEEVEALLYARYSGKTLTTVYNRQYETTDMLFSMKTGLEALGPCDAFFLLPGDMPAVERGTYLKEAAAFRETGAKAVFPTIAGRRKHPPLISAACIPEILSYQGADGLRGVWKRCEEETATVAVDDPGCEIDTDTMDDYENLLRYLRNKNPASSKKQQGGKK